MSRFPIGISPCIQEFAGIYFPTFLYLITVVCRWWILAVILFQFKGTCYRQTSVVSTASDVRKIKLCPQVSNNCCMKLLTIAQWPRRPHDLPMSVEI